MRYHKRKINETRGALAVLMPETCPDLLIMAGGTMSGFDPFGRMAIHRALSERWADLAAFNAGHSNGAVYIRVQGQDCDGVQYGYGQRLEVADYAAFKAWDKHRREWLDGPESVEIVSIEEYQAIESFKRDTFAEKAGY